MWEQTTPAPMREANAVGSTAATVSAGAKKVQPLTVSGAFHSPLMEPAAERLRTALEATPVGELQIPVYSNGTAAPFVDVRSELSQNLLRGVRWRETLLAMRTAGIERFVELGPGSVLTGLVKRIEDIKKRQTQFQKELDDDLNLEHPQKRRVQDIGEG